jgi:hypothetical protein
MDKSLDLFLHPNRKPHQKFKLGSFGDAEFEMKILSADEGAKASIEVQEKKLQGIEVFYPAIAESLVSPNLHSTEFLAELSKREGRTILSTIDALKALFTSDEISALITIYNDYADVTVDFGKRVDEVKN